jgi:hypothetical protein
MSAEARRFHAMQIAGSILANVPINAAFAWVFFREPTAPLFAYGPCVAVDTLGTSFFLPLITALILTPMVRRMQRRGLAPELRFVPWTRRAFGWLPSRTLARGLALGGISIVLFTPLVVGPMAAMGIVSMTRTAVITFKAAYGAALGVIVTPPLVLCAIAARD